MVQAEKQGGLLPGFVLFFFLNLHSGEWNQGPLDTATT
jgi:hypothetical protein